jgi:predicted permease
MSVARRDELLGDLIEDVARRREAHGRLSTGLWLIREIRSLCREYADAGGTAPSPRRGWGDALWQDVWYALRGYRRTPLFTAATVLALTLGIGATTTMFAVVDAIVLRPLPFRDADRLVRVYESRPSKGDASISPPNFFDLRAQAQSFTGLAAFWSPDLTTTDGQGHPIKVLAATCSYNLFDVLGASVALGRPFAAADDVPGAPRVVVLSDGLWRQSFGADSAIVGRTILVDNTPAEVVGVMPPNFEFPTAGTELWAPLALSPSRPPNPAIPLDRYRNYRILNVIGRIRDDRSFAQASADLARASRSLDARFPASDHGMALKAVSLHEVTVGSIRPVLLVLLAAVSCVLLIACANVGGLFLVRGATRERELSIRVALGAARVRLVSQLLTESVVLGLAGGVGGTIVAFGGLAWLRSVSLPGMPRVDALHIDLTTLAFTMSIALSAGLLFGLAPALQRRARVDTVLRAAGRSAISSGHRVLRQGLVVAEIAVSVILLSGASLLTETLVHLERVDVGFTPSNVLTVDRIDLRRTPSDPRVTAAFYDDLLARVRAIPGTSSVGLTLGLPLDPRAHFYVDDSTFSIEGRGLTTAADRPSAALHVVSADYFKTLGIPLLRGRWFDDRDQASGAGVMLINEAMARRFWPGQNPVGQRLTHDLAIVPGQQTTREIVGIVGDVRHFGLQDSAEPQMFVPHPQMPWPSMAMVLRTTGDPARVSEAVRSAVWSLDRTIPVPPARPLDHVIADALGQPRLRAALIGSFAIAALLLAMVGLYGTTAYSVRARTRELGLRMALGATPREVSRLMLRHSLLLTLAGIAVGLGVAVVGTRVLATLLFGVGPMDAETFSGIATVLLVTSAVACYVPVRRVYRIDPVSALSENV